MRFDSMALDDVRLEFPNYRAQLRDDAEIEAAPFSNRIDRSGLARCLHTEIFHAFAQEKGYCDLHWRAGLPRTRATGELKQVLGGSGNAIGFQERQ
jgi:hypothetical protein